MFLSKQYVTLIKTFQPGLRMFFLTSCKRRPDSQRYNFLVQEKSKASMLGREHDLLD